MLEQLGFGLAAVCHALAILLLILLVVFFWKIHLGKESDYSGGNYGIEPGK
jgi:hypothetical protein